MDESFNYQNNLDVSGSIPSVDPQVASVGMGIFAGIMVFVFVFALIVYVYYAFCLMKIAQRTNTLNSWFAWIPILNLILMLQIAKRPLWWILLMLVPLANLIITIIIWIDIAKALKKPEWLGVLVIVPIANLILPAYLAFSKEENAMAPKVVS